MDKGYCNARVFAETRERSCVPIICLRKGQPIPLDRIPYGSDEWKRLYRGRSAVEREFGRLKNEYGLTPLRTRGLARVTTSRRPRNDRAVGSSVDPGAKQRPSAIQPRRELTPLHPPLSVCHAVSSSSRSVLMSWTDSTRSCLAMPAPMSATKPIAPTPTKIAM